MNLIETKFNIDIDNEQQLEAFNTFIKALKGTNGASPVVTAPVKDIRPAATQPATTASAPAAQATQPATTAATTQPASGSTGSNKLDAIRKLIGLKAADHREAMKSKLAEFGVETATDLPVDRYDEFHKYLEAL